MKELQLKPGMLLKNGIGQYTKVIETENGSHGLTGWQPLHNAKESNVIALRLNDFGLELAGATIADAKGKDATADKTPAASTPAAKVDAPVATTTPRAPRKVVAKKVAAKKVAKKVTRK